MSNYSSHLSSCKLYLTNDDKTVNKSLLCLQAHAGSFLGVGIAYPRTRPRPRPGSNHAKSAGVKHAEANDADVLVLLPVTNSISYVDLLAHKTGRWFSSYIAFVLSCGLRSPMAMQRWMLQSDS